ncbi:MAG: hypothetical protein WAU95_22780, partial [Anaerolineae bacterium]
NYSKDCICVNSVGQASAVPNVAHIQPQKAHAGVGEHKETADQAQIGNFSAFFVISVVKNQATFGTADWGLDWFEIKHLTLTGGRRRMAGQFGRAAVCDG